MHGVYKLQVSQNARQIPAQAALLSYRHINVQDAELSQRDPVASLWWVTPGAATEGVTSLFFLKKTLRPFLLISHHCHFLLISLGCHPWRVSPTPFLPVRPRFSTILCKFAHKNFLFRWHPLEDVTWGGPPPPPCDATRELQNTLQDAFVLARPKVAD